MKEEKRWISSQILFSAISEQLAAGRQAVFTVTGMSMWPLICHGRDQVIIEKTDKDDLRIGDIVLFCAAEDKYILHRITRMKDGYFQTTGDGNLFRDPVMPYECVQAKVCKVIRDGKTIDCSFWGWKVLFRFWMFLFPIRKWIFRGWFWIRRLFRGK